MRARYENATTNLLNHARACDPKFKPANQQSITEYRAAGAYDKGAFRFQSALWVSSKYRPFAIIEDAPLVKMFQILNSTVETVSAKTVSKDVKEVMALSRPRVKKFLEVRLSLLYFISLSLFFVLQGYPRRCSSLFRWLDLTQHYIVSRRRHPLCQGRQNGLLYS